MKIFWMVLGDNKNQPYFKHETLQEANKEANRLAFKNPETNFYVLKAINVRLGNVEIKGCDLEDC